MTTLAARRLTSHSNDAGSVSSKSLTSKTRRRSGAANRPKFRRWASPYACTLISVVGVWARSQAIGAAAPRKYGNWEAAIRVWRIPTMSDTRLPACSLRMSTGSGRFGGGFHSAWSERGTSLRRARPSLRHSSGDNTSCDGETIPGVSLATRALRLQPISLKLVLAFELSPYGPVAVAVTMTFHRPPCAIPAMIFLRAAFENLSLIFFRTLGRTEVVERLVSNAWERTREPPEEPSDVFGPFTLARSFTVAAL